MISRLFFLSILILTGSFSPVFSQSVGIGTNSPNTNAALDIVAPNGDQGILLPRLSGAQRIGMSLGNAERGLIVYDTSDNAFYYWDGSQWLRGLGNSAGSDYQNLAFEQATALLSIENGNSVNLSSLINDADADPANEAITDFRITATAIEIEENGAVVGSIPLSGLPSGGGTDDQQLSLAGNVISLEDGGSVDLSGILFSGDFSDLANVPPNLDVDATDDLVSGANISLLTNDAGYINNPDDADADPTNEAITDFRITATAIEIEENGAIVGSIPLSGLPSGGGTDDQQITQFALSGALSNQLQLTLEDDASGQKSVDLHNMEFDAASDLTNTLGQATIKDGAVTNVKISDLDPSKLNQEGASNGDVLKWNGTNWVPDTDQTGVIPAVTEYMALDPSQFTMLFRNNGVLDKNHMLIFANNNEFVTVRDASEESEMIAPLNFPDGATINDITIYYMDNAPMNIRIELFRKSFTGGNELMASWQSSSNTDLILNDTMGTISNAVVDNSQYSYRIVVDLPGNTDEITNPNQAEHRLYGIRIQYTK